MEKSVFLLVQTPNFYGMFMHSLVFLPNDG